MKGLHFVLLFTAMTFISWGTYGPVLRHGTHALDKDALRAFVGVGLAYFLIAVVIPLVILKISKENGSWTFSGIVYSLVAGSVGALGALGVILALGYGGDPVYVMPIVFGFAPVVNTLVTAYLGKTFRQIRPIFIGGIVTAALGAVGVLVFHSQGTSKPASVPQANPARWNIQLNTAEQGGATTQQPTIEAQAPAESSQAQDSAASTTAEQASPAGDEKAKPDESKSADSQSTVPVQSSDPGPKDKLAIALSIVMAALCWGSYGPMLHIGQSKMSGSRLRPFMCVGIAYFLIAVFVPLVLILIRSVDKGSWTAEGMTWAFMAGVAGALGALGVILAFNAGGKPIYVMPLVFGFAPVVNTSITLSEKNAWGQVQPMFWVSLAAVIAGAVTVLITAPKPKPKPGT